jgi:hypothetical protein
VQILFPLNSTPLSYNFPTRSALHRHYSVAFLYFPHFNELFECASEKLLIIWDVSLFFLLHIVIISYVRQNPSICINPGRSHTHINLPLYCSQQRKEIDKKAYVWKLIFLLCISSTIHARCNECLSHKCTRDVKIVKLYSIKKWVCECGVNNAFLPFTLSRVKNLSKDAFMPLQSTKKK